MNCLQNDAGNLEATKMNDEHELAINDIPKTISFFSIPYYQRGYRWTKTEVTALLDDFLTFVQKRNISEEVYCLQPLVLKKIDDRKYKVVDGQQRLTTMYIILRLLDINPGWDIEYTAEGGQKLSSLLCTPGDSINDDFREKACGAVKTWLQQGPSRKNALCKLLSGAEKNRVVFLRYEIATDEDGHAVFQRMNADKTPLTSSELIRALFMEAGNGLSDGEKTDIAKEWDLIESSIADEKFWAIWNNRDFRDIPTRMDFLFSIIAGVDSKKARHDGLLIYRKIEEMVKRIGLAATWEETLRCWWWMQSCFSDDKSYHLLGWLSLFSSCRTRGLWDIWKKDCRMESFKKKLQQLVVSDVKEKDFDAFRYDPTKTNELRGVFVLLNILEAQRRHIRFRFDLYLLHICKKGVWDIEHIASQTDNPLTEKKDQEEWLELAKKEMTKEEIKCLDEKDSFDKKWAYVNELFENKDDTITDKDAIGNLALLDSETNRSYKNAIFPSKRRIILEKSLKKDCYIPPATEAVFAKMYSPSAAQMRYWGRSDASDYRDTMKPLFDGFMEEVK